MKRDLIYLLIIFAVVISACSEHIKMETENGPQLTGIFGMVTAENKNHTVKITKTMPFYSTDSAECVSGASVVVYYDADGQHVVQRYVETEKGLYESEAPFAGQHGVTYHLDVTTYGVSEDETQHFTAECLMMPNIDKIDSIRIGKYKLGELEFKHRLGVYPYFQSLPDKNIYYMGRLMKNDTLLSDTITECVVASMEGFSGMYFNGPQMAALSGEIAAYYLDQRLQDEKLRDGDTVTLLIGTVTKKYANYISDISSSSGSNPMMGMPSNVSTNISPSDKAVGFFTAYSEVSFTDIYHEEEEEE